ncbi:tyrosine-type recombinase/integrase [Vibrio harveyi]
MYLSKSRHGIYYFRWSVRNQHGKYNQAKISLKTHCKLTAVNRASELAIHFKLNPPCSIQEVREYLNSSQCSVVGTSIDASTDLLESKLNDLVPKSRQEYLSCWKTFVSSIQTSYGCVPLNKVNQLHLDKWKSEQTCASKTLRKKLRLIASCLKRLGIRNDLDFNIKIDKSELTQKSRRAMTFEEIRSLLEATDTYRDYRYYLPRMALVTGCRLNELCQLRKSDFIRENNHFWLSINADHEDKHLKTINSQRMIPVSKALEELIMPLLKTRGIEQHLFDLPFDEQNRFISKPSKFFSRTFSNLRKQNKVGENVSFHSIRHTVVTHLFEQGFNEESIGSITGHSTGKTTAGKVYKGDFNYSVKFELVSNLERLLV